MSEPVTEPQQKEMLKKRRKRRRAHRTRKIFVACDSNNISKVKKIISKTQSSKIKVGYKFGLEFLNSKNGRLFISKIWKKIIFADLKLNDIQDKQIDFSVTCSKGTYIRVLGQEIAKKLGTEGHLTKLQRIAVGDFLIQGRNTISPNIAFDFLIQVVGSFAVH